MGDLITCINQGSKIRVLPRNVSVRKQSIHLQVSHLPLFHYLFLPRSSFHAVSPINVSLFGVSSLKDDAVRTFIERNIINARVDNPLYLKLLYVSDSSDNEEGTFVVDAFYRSNSLLGRMRRVSEELCLEGLATSDTNENPGKYCSSEVHEIQYRVDLLRKLQNSEQDAKWRGKGVWKRNSNNNAFKGFFRRIFNK